MSPTSERGNTVRCLSFMFSAITSAMQPARLPIALLTVLLVSALVPIVDLAGGKQFGPRGFASGPMSDTEVELSYQRARSAANRLAGDEIDRLEEEARASSAGPAHRISRGQLAAAVREATARKIEERLANGVGSGDPEIEKLRQRAAESILVIDESAPRGVATTFIAAEFAAARQAAAGVLGLDVSVVIGAVTAALVTTPAAAIRECPMVAPLAIILILSLVSVLAGGSCRMAAVHAGRSARLTALEGAFYARGRLLNLVVLPVLPALLVALLGLVVVVFALLLRVPVLNVLSALLFIIPICVALLAAIVAVTAIAAFPLMPAAIAVEDCDAGDAITRAGALVLARPLAWIGLLALSVAALSIGGVLVNAVLSLASGGVNAALVAVGGATGVSLGSGDASEVGALTGPDRLVGLLIGFWRGLMGGLLAAYLFSLACDLATRAYLWTRERVDGENPATIAGYGVR